jgi:asparagine synthase (glutamine-hydrolysing)
LSWLTDRANGELRKSAADEVAREPLRWSERRHWWSLRRATEIGLQSLDLIAEDHAAQIRHPLTDVGFASSVERFAARHRLHDRTSVLLRAFSSVLPSSILERTSKAAFDAAFFGNESRALAEVVVEQLADLEIVAPAALREEWSSASPDAHSYLLLQAGHVRLASTRNLDFGTVAPRAEES